MSFDDLSLLQEPGYHPQVEAISPTPDDRTQERDDVKSTKDDLLQKISKVDREIAKAESQIAKLKKKQVQYSNIAMILNSFKGNVCQYHPKSDSLKGWNF